MNPDFTLTPGTSNQGSMDSLPHNPGNTEPHGPTDPVTSLYAALRESHQSSSQSIERLVEALNQYVQIQTVKDHRPVPTSVGPRPREPKPYDGDRSNGKLDDHLRDLTNWLSFYNARGHWQDEAEQIEYASTHLSSRIYRLYVLHRTEFSTVAGYCEWLRRTFKDRNEQTKLRNEWHALVQGSRSVQEYATALLYLRSQIQPIKTDPEVKEHFFLGLDKRLQMKLMEDPNNESLPLNTFMDLADRWEQILESQQVLVKGTRTYDSQQLFALQGAPRRGGRGPIHRPCKGTQEWTQHCNKKDACYACGRPGHRANACPQSDTSEKAPKRDESRKDRRPFAKGRKGPPKPGKVQS